MPIYSSQHPRPLNMTKLISTCNLRTHCHFPGTQFPQFRVSSIDIAMTHSLVWFESDQPSINRPCLTYLLEIYRHNCHTVSVYFDLKTQVTHYLLRILFRRHTSNDQRSTYILKRVRQLLFTKSIVAIWCLPTDIDRKRASNDLVKLSLTFIDFRVFFKIFKHSRGKSSRSWRFCLNQ